LRLKKQATLVIFTTGDRNKILPTSLQVVNKKNYGCCYLKLFLFGSWSMNLINKIEASIDEKILMKNK
jgi:hypothetical protein